MCYKREVHIVGDYLNTIWLCFGNFLSVKYPCLVGVLVCSLSVVYGYVTVLLSSFGNCHRLAVVSATYSNTVKHLDEIRYEGRYITLLTVSWDLLGYVVVLRWCYRQTVCCVTDRQTDSVLCYRQTYIETNRQCAV